MNSMRTIASESLVSQIPTEYLYYVAQLALCVIFHYQPIYLLKSSVIHIL